MSLLPRLFSSRCLTPASFQRIAFGRCTKAYFSGSSDGGDKPSQTGISSLLSSLKKKDKNVDLKDLLQRGKPVKEPLLETTTNLNEIENDVKAVTGEESRKVHIPSKSRSKASDVSETMTKIFKSDTENLPVTPEMHNKLKSILSELKVDSAQTNLSKDIIGAAKSWGRVSPRYRKDIVSDFAMQSRGDSSTVPRLISLSEGVRFNIFDDVFDRKIPLAEPASELSLLESIEMEMLQRHKSLDQRNDFISLMEISDKQWKIPVDNEVCKVEEESVGFEAHVFLGYLLDGFPKKGPVRRFMELVVNGLEQNPHMTVGQKQQQVEWFKEYFDNVPEEDLSF